MYQDPFPKIAKALADRYEVKHRIGIGGMSSVYLAEDRRHQRPVAIKVLRPDLAATLGSDRFLREIAIAARLQHPHILTLIDSGEAEGFLYYVMPFVEGESLRRRLNHEGELPVEDVVSIMHDVADALAHAHAQGVVHRDIKPDNILLTGRQAQVMDFGVAKAVSEASARSGITSAGTAVGTPAYMAPEQAAADPNVDHRADIYALGVVAYELLTGRIPFEHESPQQLIAAHVTQDPVPLLDVRSTVPPGVAEVVMRCLAKRPADRWQSADELVRALETVRTTGGSTSGIASGVRIATAVRRRWWPWIAGAAMIAVGIGGWLVMPRGGGAPQQAALDPAKIAVLYFDDRSPSQNMGYLADGLTEALIQELSSVDALRVISRNGVRPFRHGTVTLDSIVRALDVGTIVEGSVARSGDVVRVTVDLVDAQTEEHLASATLEQPWEELFALQDTLSAEVSRFLRQRLGQEIELHEQRAGARSVEAWDLVRQAERRRSDASDLAAAGDTAGARALLGAADTLLLRAERADRNWIEPVLLQGWIAADLAQLPGGMRFAFDAEWNRRSLALADRALDRAPQNAEALELRGTAEWRLSLDPDASGPEELQDAAERDLRAAVAADPGRASAWSTLSTLLRRKAQFTDAQAAAKRALEEDQFLRDAATVVRTLYETSLDLKQIDEADRWCNEGKRRFPANQFFAICDLFLVTLPNGPTPNVREGWAALDRLIQLTSPQSRGANRAIGLAWMSAILARAGRDDSARAVLTRARDTAATSLKPWIDYYGANTALLLGDRPDALRRLDSFLQANPGRKAYVAADWMFEDLQSDSTFKAMVDTTK